MKKRKPGSAADADAARKAAAVSTSEAPLESTTDAASDLDSTLTEEVTAADLDVSTLVEEVTAAGQDASGEDVTAAAGQDVSTVGEDVTAAGQDVSSVGEDVTAASQDVSVVGEGLTAVSVSEGDETEWDDIPTAVAGAAKPVDRAPGEYAATWADDGGSGDDGAEAPQGDDPQFSEGPLAASAETIDDTVAADDAALPDDDSRFESILESLLFAADRPLSVADLKRLLGERDSKRLSAALESLRARRAESGVQLISVAGGWQLRTHPGNGAWVAKLVSGRPQRLSRAMMETLAIVAYRQPITRPEIDEIRGVDCGPVLRTLLDRTLIRVIGKKEEVGRPILYGTTPEFLKTFSLRDLTELPTLREFHELGAEEQARVDATTPAAEGAPMALPTGAAPLRPSTVDLPEVDTAEEDALLEELEQATQLAGRATKAPIDPEAEVAQEATASETGDT